MHFLFRPRRAYSPCRNHFLFPLAECGHSQLQLARVDTKLKVNPTAHHFYKLNRGNSNRAKSPFERKEKGYSPQVHLQGESSRTFAAATFGTGPFRQLTPSHPGARKFGTFCLQKEQSDGGTESKRKIYFTLSAIELKFHINFSLKVNLYSGDESTFR